MLEIRKELFQWEKERYVHISRDVNKPHINCVQFYNKKSKTSEDSFIEDEKAKIPNSLLRESLPIVALGCIKDSEGTKVICRREFKVLPRVKPGSYIDEDTYRDVIYDGGVEV